MTELVVVWNGAHDRASRRARVVRGVFRPWSLGAKLAAWLARQPAGADVDARDVAALLNVTRRDAASWLNRAHVRGLVERARLRRSTGGRRAQVWRRI